MGYASTQWTEHGLSYPALYLVAESLAITVDQMMLRKIRVMEQVTNEYLRETTKADAERQRRTNRESRHDRQARHPDRHYRQ